MSESDTKSETLSQAMKGNQNGVKLKDLDVRQRAYKAYCDWLARGKTKKSFSFIEDEYYCTWGTIDKYVKEAPAEFDPKKIEAAYAQGCAKWEEVVDQTGEGKNTKSSVPCLNMIMRNKFKWDTTEQINEDREKQSDLNRFVVDQEKARGEYNATKYAGRSAAPEKTAPAQEDGRTDQ